MKWCKPNIRNYHLYLLMPSGEGEDWEPIQWHPNRPVTYTKEEAEETGKDYVRTGNCLDYKLVKFDPFKT